MTSQQSASFGDYVLAGLLLAIILFATARAFLRAIGLRPPARKRIYVEVPHPVEYVLSPQDREFSEVMSQVRAYEQQSDRDTEMLQERILEDEAALLPVVTPIYR